jgi:tripartite motif-containing protein 56
MVAKQVMTTSEKLCDPCQFNTESVKAVSWCPTCEEGLCKSCVKSHRSFKISSSHVIVPLEEIILDKISLGIRGINYCSEHSGKIIEVYCVDHSRPCCTLCATLSHRKCETVISIDIAAAGIRQSTKPVDLSKELQQKSKHIDEMIENRKENIGVIDKKTADILANIEEVKDVAIKHLNEVTNKMKEKVTSSKKNTVITLSDEATELSSIKCTVDNWKAILDTCVQHGSDQQCLVEMDRITRKNFDLNKEIKEAIFKRRKSLVTFEPNKFLSEFQTNVEYFGDLTLDSFPEVDFLYGSIQILKTIEIDINKIGTRQISGIFVQNILILTDSINRQVIKYNENYVYLSNLSVPKPVSDITSMEQDTVAVASAFSDDIYVIDVKTMTLTKTIKVSTTLYSLQYVEGEFITAYKGTLTWLSAKGLRLRESKTSVGALFVRCFSKNSYICGDGGNAISYTKDKRKQFIYFSPTLSISRGIDVDVEGNVYSVGFKSNNIHQITSEGEHVRTISTTDFGIWEPWVLRFKPKSAVFLLTSFDTGKAVICKID